MSDPHYGNIMRDARNQPTIIDARALRLGLPLPRRKAFGDVNDDDW